MKVLVGIVCPLGDSLDDVAVVELINGDLTRELRIGSAHFVSVPVQVIVQHAQVKSLSVCGFLQILSWDRSPLIVKVKVALFCLFGSLVGIRLEFSDLLFDAGHILGNIPFLHSCH